MGTGTLGYKDTGPRTYGYQDICVQGHMGTGHMGTGHMGAGTFGYRNIWVQGQLGRLYMGHLGTGTGGPKLAYVYCAHTL